MHVHTFHLGDYQTNTYIIENEGHCAIIDPGYEAETILAFLKKRELTVDAILLTHGHFDHVGAVERLVAETGCKLWMKESDYTQFKTPENDFFYPIHDCDFTEVQFCEDGDRIHAGGLTFAVMETPGHTWGSVCYLCGDTIFSGDTLFAGSCGRTDLPGGDWNTILNSLKRLSELEGDFTVCPGHGNSTTLSAEKLYNPYMR